MGENPPHSFLIPFRHILASRVVEERIRQASVMIRSIRSDSKTSNGTTRKRVGVREREE